MKAGGTTPASRGGSALGGGMHVGRGMEGEMEEFKNLIHHAKGIFIRYLPLLMSAEKVNRVLEGLFFL